MYFSLSNLFYAPLYLLDVVFNVYLYLSSFGCLFQSKMVAEQLAAKLNNRLNYIPEVDRQAMWQEEEEEEEQAPPPPRVICKYEEELDINDFPQRTRWKITSKVGLLFITPFLV